MTTPRPSYALASIVAVLRAQHTPAPRCSRAPWRDGLCRECACRSAGVAPAWRAK